MTLDLTESIVPKSDQLNADEMVAGPATYTIREVKAGSTEQPFDFLLVETDRAYRPSKTMRRVIVNAWGASAANYAGRRLTLYREPTIKFAGKEVGGIRISHMSHIDGPVELMAQTTRGTREKFVVKPLASAAPVEAPPVLDDDAVTVPFVADGKLGDALAALSLHQRVELFTECGIPMVDGKVDPPMKLADLRTKLWAKWSELHLPDDQEGEPVPVAILGAIYAKRAAETSSDAAESFGIFAETGQDLDVDPQTVIA